ncbi:hypothetical protein K7640_14885 [Micromonospora sp. PLK6-60]|uniref:hypothetical protein n=1 Tax=Micromonospora sp. PLK6-60 TaxID=2873383 RepID=UPI001CA5FF89|nr:hypothetical protein [Micromonospora sp. PLK6-60]MBY8873119.1 hypothetical protein [Micromonospora sp. PLK6-60]
MQPAGQLRWEVRADVDGRDGSPDGTPAGPAGEQDCVVTALNLGWWLADAFHTLQHGYPLVPEEDDADATPADGAARKLKNLSGMPVGRRLRMYLDGTDVALDRIAATVRDRRPRPSTQAARLRLGTVDNPSDPQAEEVLDALDDLNMEVLRWTMAINHRVGLAYRLGRSLADTVRRCRRDPIPPRFDGRAVQLCRWLEALASVLPRYAAEVVRGSLLAWTRTVHHWGTDGSETGEVRRVLRDQGELWRGVLTGGLDPRDLLDEEDYAWVARKLVVRDRNLIVATTRGIFRPVLLPLLGVLLAVVAVSAVAASGSPATRGAIALVGLGGGLAAIWRSVSRPALAAAGQINRPLLDGLLVVRMVRRLNEPLRRLESAD